MTWNHRVVKRTVKEFGKDVEEFGIHECFYDTEGRKALTENPVSVVGNSIDELRETLERMLRCLKRPVIDGDVE